MQEHTSTAVNLDGARRVPRLAIIRQILGGDGLPKRYQNPKLEIRRDVARPYYFVRLTVPTVDGRRKRIPQFLVFVDETSKREAMAIRAERLEVVNQGRVLLQAQIRFKDLVKQFTEARIPEFKSSTQDWYRSLIDTHLLPVFGEKQLMQIDCQSVEAFLVGREQAGLSWWTRKGLLGVMAAIFNAARDWKLWSGDSPTVGVRLGKKREVREKRLLSPDDLRRLLGAVEGQVRFIILIIFGTGLRISEALGLRWWNIDLDGGTLTVQQRWYRGDLDEPKTEASERTRQLGPW